MAEKAGGRPARGTETGPPPPAPRRVERPRDQRAVHRTDRSDLRWRLRAGCIGWVVPGPGHDALLIRRSGAGPAGHSLRDGNRLEDAARVRRGACCSRHMAVPSGQKRTVLIPGGRGRAVGLNHGSGGLCTLSDIGRPRDGPGRAVRCSATDGASPQCACLALSAAAGAAGVRVTGKVYREQSRRVSQTGAVVMDGDLRRRPATLVCTQESDGRAA